MEYMLRELFVPGWVIWFIVIAALVLVISLLFLSKKVNGLEETAEELSKKENKHSFRKPGFRLPD